MDGRDGGKRGIVRRRKVFYLPGFDPVPPRRYRELYRREGAQQARYSGYQLVQVSRTERTGPGWAVSARIDGQDVDTDVEVLVWSDIVRASMSGSVPDTYMQLFRTVRTYVGSGALFRLMPLRKGPVIAALYPVVFLLGQLLIAVAIAVALGAGLAELTVPAAWVLGLAMVPPVLNWFRRNDGRVMAWYLMHDYAFIAERGGAYPPVLEDRLERFADRVAGALESGDWDEVLVVGHSSGAYLAVSVLADLVRDGRASAQGPALGLLTLGHVTPMVSFLPEAGRLRADLRLLSTADELTWVDVSAPGDGCSFALCDPVAVSGVAPSEGKRWPLVISAAFTRTLSPERQRALRWRFFRLHLQYLHAFDRAGVYDYFAITAGPLSLAQRFDGRAPSRSRIERPASGHTSLAA